MERLSFWRPLDRAPSSSIALRQFVTQPPATNVKVALRIVNSANKGLRSVSHATRIIQVQNEHGVLLSDILRESLAEEKMCIGNICWKCRNAGSKACYCYREKRRS